MLRILRWKDHLALFGWDQCNHKDPYQAKQRESKESNNDLNENEIMIYQNW